MMHFVILFIIFILSYSSCNIIFFGRLLIFFFYSQEGPPHASTFTIKLTLTLLNREFIGTGLSKKAAKTDAARKALDSGLVV